MRIPDAVIEQVKDRVDIVAVLGRHVQLKRAGRNHVGLCPFHAEKSPSFNVSGERKSYHCFGCGEGGNVFTFLARVTNQPFPQVVKDLAKEVGIEVAEREETPEERAAERVKQRQLVILERALHVYLEQLQSPHGAGARDYLATRHFGPKSHGEFELGFGGVARDLLWHTLGKSEEDKADLITAGLCVSNERGQYDRFSGRIIFPIRDDRFHVIGFGGRAFGDKDKKGVAKYLNSPESPLYDKSSVFYRAPQAFQKARRGAPVVVVEGYFDAMAMEQAGIAAVASCGTALTPRHAAVLDRLQCPVVLCWDGDAAGERAVAKAGAVLLPLKVETRIAVLPSGDDPDTYVARVGVLGAARLVGEAEPLAAWVIGAAARAAEDAGDDVQGRLEAIGSLTWLFQAIPAGLERDMYLTRAAQKLGVDKAQLTAELKVGAERDAKTARALALVRPHGPDSPGPDLGRAPAPWAASQPLSGEEATLVRLLAEHPEQALPLDEHPLANQLSPGIRPFLAFVREKVQEAGPFSPESSIYKELQERAPHPQVVQILDDVARNHRVFLDEEAAEKAVFQLLAWLQRNDLMAQRHALLAEAGAASARGDTAAAHNLQAHLWNITQALKQLEQRPAAQPQPNLQPG